MSLCKLFCLHFVTQHARFLSGMFIVSWLELQKQQLKEGVNHSFQSGWVQRFTKWFGGEMELCYDIMLWFTHTSSALLSEISHGEDGKILVSRNMSLEGLARVLEKTGQAIFMSLQESPSRYIHIYTIVSGAIWAILVHITRAPVGAEGEGWKRSTQDKDTV